MKYMNKRTKIVIDVESEIKGENWERVDEEKKASSVTTKKTGTRRKASEK